MASVTSKTHCQKKLPVGGSSQRTQSWIQQNFEAPSRRLSFSKAASTWSAKSLVTTPILNLPYEILNQICQEVVRHHLPLDEVDTRRCSSRRCLDRGRSKTARPILPFKKCISNETVEMPFSQKLELPDSENDASTNAQIPLLLVCKKIHQIVQEILYANLVFHVHIQALGVDWRLRDDFVQFSNLNLYGHKLRNVIIVLEVNTTTQGTAFSRGRHFRKEQVDRQNSHNDKVYERKNQLQHAVEMLLQDRQDTIIDLSVDLSIIPELAIFEKGPVPKWKVALVQDTLQPLGDLRGHVRAVTVLPLETKLNGSLPAIQVYSHAFELHDTVNATVKSLILA
jgi:hypothetical protein